MTEENAYIYGTDDDELRRLGAQHALWRADAEAHWTRAGFAAGMTVADIDRWVVHPGGRDILEGVRRGLELDPACLSESERVLERHGNMSSATILWVLKRPGGSA